jgi:hypothetical protein
MRRGVHTVHKLSPYPFPTPRLSPRHGLCSNESIFRSQTARTSRDSNRKSPKGKRYSSFTTTRWKVSFFYLPNIGKHLVQPLLPPTYLLQVPPTLSLYLLPASRLC